jgi:hypothetical protein
VRRVTLARDSKHRGTRVCDREHQKDWGSFRLSPNLGSLKEHFGVVACRASLPVEGVEEAAQERR